MAGANNKEQIEKVEDELLRQVAPHVYAGPHGEEIRFIKGFEETCILLNQHVPKDPKQMTALSFYQALEVIKEQAKERKKQSARNGK